MPEYNAGEARLRIVPDASGFKRRLDADLKKIQAEYAVKITSDTSRAQRELEVWRARENRNAINLRVDVDTTGARAQIAALRAAASGLDVSRFAGLGGDFAKLFSGGLTSPAAITGIIGLLPALGSGIADVAGAIQTLAQGGLALPGIFASIGASVGTAVVGFSGMQDALEAVNKAADGTPKSIEKARQALAGLAPAARDVVTTLAGFKPQFDDLKQTVQQNIFAGLSTNIANLLNNDLPILKSGMGEIATAWNHTFEQLTGSLGSDSSKGLLDRILGDTAHAQEIANRAIDPLVHALGTLTAAGTGDALPRLSEDLRGLADRFNNFITAAAADGRLDTWIRNGITGFEHLSDTIGNIASAFSSIASAAGGDLLKNLDDVTQKFSNWLNSADGQAKLTKFLAEGKTQLGNIADILKNLGPAFGTAFDGATTAVGTLLTSLKQITSWYDALPEFLKVALNKGATGALNPAALIKQPFDVLTAPSAQDAAQAKRDAAVAAAKPGLPPSTGPVAPGPAIPGPNTGAPRNPLDVFLPPRAAGGPTPSGRGPGPTGGWPSEIHSDEWILPAHARAAVGDQALWALTSGRSFEPGGYVDQWGNPITRGPAPGGPPASVAPNPTGTSGGISDIFGKIASGIQGPIGNALSLGSSLAGAAQGQGAAGSAPSFADKAAGIPGLFGLIGSAASSDPGTNLLNWGEQTGQWLGNFAAKTAGAFGSALWSGALGLVGLDNSILSPTNPWFQAGSQGAQFALGSDGPVGTLLGSGKSGSASDLSATDLSALQQSGVGHLAADRVTGQSTAPRSSAVPGPSLGATTPKGSNESIVYQAMLAAGFPASEWPALKHVIDHESGFRPAAQNPSSTAFGMFQFLDSTWSSVGGTKTSDPATQAQYGLQYIKQRYGTPSAAWSFWQGHNSYSFGGGARGPGGPKGDQIPALLSDNEHVFTSDDVDAMGGQGAVYAFRKSLHRVGGGQIMGNVSPEWGRDLYGDEKGGSKSGGPYTRDLPGWWKQRVNNAQDSGVPWWWVGGNWGQLPFDPAHPPLDPKAVHRATGGGIMPLGNVGIDPGWIIDPNTGTRVPKRHGALWDFGPNSPLPRAAGPNDPLIPYQPPPGTWWPNLWGEYGPGEWNPSDPNFPKPNSPRQIYRDNRRGVGGLGRGFADGGVVTALPVDPRQPLPRPPDARPIAPRPAPTPSTLGPPSLQPPAAGRPAPPPPASVAPSGVLPPTVAPSDAVPSFYTGGGGSSAIVDTGPPKLDHNLPAIDKGIDSAASAIGQALSTAIGIAGGAAGGFGGGAVGAIGPYVAGLVQQGGKIAKDVVNVGSSFLVGNVTPGTTPNPYGQTLRPQQNEPITAGSGNTQINTFNGMDVPHVFQELDLRSAQQEQAALAHRRIR